jgi:hypothetical protein
MLQDDNWSTDTSISVEGSVTTFQVKLTKKSARPQTRLNLQVSAILLCSLLFKLQKQLHFKAK